MLKKVSVSCLLPSINALHISETTSKFGYMHVAFKRTRKSDYFPVHGMSSQMKRQTSVGSELNNGKRSEWKIR